MELQQFVFSGQAIRQIKQGNDLWISLTDCAKLAEKRFKISEIIKSKQYKLYREALNGEILTFEDIDEGISVLDANIISIKGKLNNNYYLEPGTWLNIAEESGRLQLLYFAQIINPVFHIQCNKHIWQLITEGYVISETATSAQLVKAEAQLLKLSAKLEVKQNQLVKSKKEARRNFNQMARLSERLTNYEENLVTSEAMLSSKLHELFAICGFQFRKEAPFKYGRKIVRFDAYRETYKRVVIHEYKFTPISYETVGQELFDKKNYFEMCKGIWPDKLIELWLISPIVDEIAVQRYSEHMSSLLGNNFVLKPCQLDGKYFNWLKRCFVKKCLTVGLTHDDAYEQWIESGAEEITSDLLKITQTVYNIKLEAMRPI